VEGTATMMERQTQLKVKLAPGSYVIVPTCTACTFQQILEEEASRDYGVAPPVVLFANPEKRTYSTLSEPAVLALAEIFNRFNFDMDGFMNKRELDFINLCIGVSPISDAMWDELLKNCDSLNGGLSLNGFKDAMIRLHVDGKTGGEEDLWTVLLALGYNRRLTLLYARSFVLAVHSLAAFQLHTSHSSTEQLAALYESAMTLPVRSLGTKRDVGGNGISIYTRKGGNNVSVAVENQTPVTITVDLDCSKSKNVISHRGSLRASEVIPSGHTVVMHHLMPRDKTAGWAWGYSIATRA